jgi:hypothetical protein
MPGILKSLIFQYLESCPVFFPMFGPEPRKFRGESAFSLEKEATWRSGKPAGFNAISSKSED